MLLQVERLFNWARGFLSLFFFAFALPIFAAEQLIVEPDAGRQPLLAAIEKAKSSVDLVMYGWTDERFLTAVSQAKNAGKQVHVLLEPSPYKAEHENAFAIGQLQADKIHLHWANPDFKLTHQKTFLLDQHSAIVMTFNLTHSSFKKERNFALIIDDPAMVKEINAVFNADWQHKTIAVHHANLIWSPDNSREKIIDFINQATSDLQIYAQDVGDYETIGALAKAARNGVSVKILTSKIQPRSKRKFGFLRKAGVEIRVSPHYFIHAKVIIADHKRAVLGSTNLTRASLNDNRELSVITRNKKTVSELVNTFEKDWD